MAFDHRDSYQKKLFGIAREPTPEETARMVAAKQVVFEAFGRALADGLQPDTAGILVDEQFGSAIAQEAKARQMLFAMPVEKSGQEEFDFEYGDAFGEHIERFDPTFAKVLVRYDAGGDQAINQRQAERLRKLTQWLHERNRKFMFELLVPAKAADLNPESQPALMTAAITQLRAAGVEPDVWKIEGLESRDHCRQVAALARAGGRDHVGCIVLGRGADAPAVERWLRAASGVPGYIGFAIGRTIWWDALKAHLEGRLDRESAASQIARTYRRMTDIYIAA